MFEYLLIYRDVSSSARDEIDVPFSVLSMKIETHDALACMLPTWALNTVAIYKLANSRLLAIYDVTDRVINNCLSSTVDRHTSRAERAQYHSDRPSYTVHHSSELIFWLGQ